MNFKDLDSNSRVWVYQADRALTPEEQIVAQEEMNSFANDWVSHGEALHAAFTVLEDHFIVLGVEPPKGKLCGGSVDSSFRFVKELGSKFNIDFFNRLKVLTINEQNEKEYVSFSRLKNCPDRLVYNNMVDSKAKFDQSFKVSVKDYLASFN